ncbi:hypothetical protein GCM10022241_22850 [Micrococcus endophyticus]
MAKKGPRNNPATELGGNDTRSSVWSLLLDRLPRRVRDLWSGRLVELLRKRRIMRALSSPMRPIVRHREGTVRLASGARKVRAFSEWCRSCPANGRFVSELSCKGP